MNPRSSAATHRRSKQNLGLLIAVMFSLRLADTRNYSGGDEPEGTPKFHPLMKLISGFPPLHAVGLPLVVAFAAVRTFRVSVEPHS
jgi:hypothetical protein